MNIKIIPLAERKLVRRKITLSMVSETVKKPESTATGYGGRTVCQKIFMVEGKEKLLRVVCEAEGKSTLVITAYLTSQVRKYLKR
jgi:hypothetical protein